MNKRRLLTLAKYLEKVPRKRFDMSEWATGPFCKRSGDERRHQCGTVACAMGWACTIPSFKKAGLHLRNIGSALSPSPSYVPRVGKSRQRAHGFFDITEDEYTNLFVFHADPDETPKQVAKRIRDFVKSEGNVVERQARAHPRRSRRGAEGT